MRIAVIGAGSIGRRHLTNLLALGERDILGCDERPAVCAQVSATQGMLMLPLLEDVWDWQPDAVLICTPPDSHFSLGLGAMARGIPVFIEKPLCMNSAEAQVLDQMGERLVTMVACNWRFHPGPLAVKRWLDEGRLGDVLSAHIAMAYDLPSVRDDYKLSYAASTGATLDVGAHAVDLALWLFGPAALVAASAWPAEAIGLPATDGAADLQLEHASGATSSVHVTFVQLGSGYLVEVRGTKGSARWHSGLSFSDALLWEGSCLAERIDLSVVGFNQMYMDEMRHFLECVRENKQSVNPIGEAAAVLNLLLEAKRCA